MVVEKDSFTSIGDIIVHLLKDGTLPFSPEDAAIWKVWDRVVGDAAGPSVSNNAKPYAIKKGVLKVEVSGPIWLQELKFRGEDIRKRLNEALGREAVTKIEFRVGPK